MGDTDISNTSSPLNLHCAAQFVIITLCDPYNLFLTFIFILCVWVFGLHVYLCNTLRGQKRARDWNYNRL